MTNWPENPKTLLRGNGWLHRWPAGLKLCLLMLASTVFVLVDHVFWLAFACAMAFGIWISVMGSGVREGLARLPWLMLTVALVVAYVIIFNGLHAGLEVLFRLLALFFLAMAVTSSTTVSDMMLVVERVLQPFAKLGWCNAQKVALTFGLSLRLVPVLLRQWQDIRQAQAARGIDAAPYALLIPMLAKTLKRADEIGEAIDARGD